MFARSRFKLSVQTLFLVFSFLFLIGTVAAQQGSLKVESDSGDAGTGGTNNIKGNVIFPSGLHVDKPIRVRLFTMTRGDITTMTDDAGNFLFRRLSVGRYTIVIDDEKDYEPVTEQVNIYQRSMGTTEQIFNVQIRLKLKAGSDIKPGVLSAEFANVPPGAMAFYKKALEEAHAGNNKAAVEQLNQAIAAYADFMLAYNELGVQYLRLGELEKADAALRSALKLAPEAFAPLMNHGIVLVGLKRYQEAEPELRDALKLKDQSALGHYYLGYALANMRRYDEAEKELTRAVALGGDEVKEAHRYLAFIYNDRGDREHAIAELETYLRLSPTSKDADHLRQLIHQLKAAKVQG
jgi:Flp pilus assembly protein TadD